MSLSPLAKLGNLRLRVNLKVTRIDDVDASKNPRPTLRMLRKEHKETLQQVI